MNERVAAAATELDANVATSIDLTGSKLGYLTDELVRTVLAPALRRNTSMTSLNVSINQLSDDGIAVLGAALNPRGQLTSLNISSNPHVTDEGVCALLDVLPPGVSILDISGCTLTKRSLETIVAKLSLPRTASGRLSLKHLEARDVQQLGDELWAPGAPFPTYLCDADCELNLLYLSGNPFSDASLPTIASIVQRNRSLTALSVSNSTYITDYYPLAQALSHNDHLVVFPLGGDGKKVEYSNVEPKLRDNRRRRATAADAPQAAHAALQAAHDVELRKLQRAHEEDLRSLQTQVAALEEEARYWREQAATVAADHQETCAPPSSTQVDVAPLDAGGDVPPTGETEEH